MFNLVLVAPEIPHNAGAAGRLCLATGSTLHLIKPLGFSLDDKHVRRTGLDYWKDVDLKLWDSLEELYASAAPERTWFLTPKGRGGALHLPVAFVPTQGAISLSQSCDPASIAVGAGERAAPGPEQFGIQQRLRERRAVE